MEDAYKVSTPTIATWQPQPYAPAVELNTERLLVLGEVAPVPHRLVLPTPVSPPYGDRRFDDGGGCEAPPPDMPPMMRAPNAAVRDAGL